MEVAYTGGGFLIALLIIRGFKSQFSKLLIKLQSVLDLIKTIKIF